MATVEPVLRPLLLRAAVEQPNDFTNWLALRLREEKGTQQQNLPPSEFSVKVNRLLRRVETKKQPKLTPQDLEVISGWLDEDSCANIDSWLPKNPGNHSIVARSRHTIPHWSASARS